VEAKEVGRWSLRHSWRALNEALPPNVRPITVLRAFFAATPYISITISVGIPLPILYSDPLAMGLGDPLLWERSVLVRCLDAWFEKRWVEWPKCCLVYFLGRVSCLDLFLWPGALPLLLAFRQ
jgi:hypothetical protein